MAMIKCPKCRHHISSMNKACPECGAPIDPEWADAEVQRDLARLQEIPFTVEVAKGEPRADEEEEAPEAEAAQPCAEEQETAAEAATGSKGGRARLWVLAWVVLLGLCAGGWYYFDYQAEREREQRAYELLKGCTNPDFYEDFIVRFPKSPRIGEVRERYAEVKAMQAEWQALMGDASREALEDYLRKHPSGRYAKVAEVRIDSLDWAEAWSRRTLEAVTAYMAKHPEGYYIDEAEAMRQTLERQRAEAEARARALRDSLARDSLAAT